MSDTASTSPAPAVTEPTPAATKPTPAAPTAPAVQAADVAAQNSRIAFLEAQLAESNKTVEERNSLSLALKAAEDRLAAIERAKTPTGEIDVKKLVEETTLIARQQADKRINDLEQRLQRTEEERRTERLSALRSRLITEAGEEVIPSLVSGNTEEEIRASIAASKEQYLAIAQRVSAKSASVPNNPSPSNVPPPVSPRGGAGGGAPTAGAAASNVRNLSKNDYANQRANIFAELQKRYPANGS